MAALLDQWETTKKDKHGKHCHNQWKHFSPFIISVNVMLGREALVVLAQLSRIMAEKMDESISHIPRVDKRLNHNLGCKILLTYDPRSLNTHFHARQGAGMGSRIGNRVGTLNHAQA